MRLVTAGHKPRTAAEKGIVFFPAAQTLACKTTVFGSKYLAFCDTGAELVRQASPE